MRESLSCAFWYIDKIGSIDEAEKIMAVAITAYREYQRKVSING